MQVEAGELVRQLIAGDPAALEAAYKQHAPRCTAIAYRVLGDNERAQDAVQEAFLALWRHRSGLVVRTAGVGPWLAVVTRNAAIGMLRSATARSQRENRAATAAATAHAPDPADLVASKAGSGGVRAALALLSAEQRTVIEMAYFGFLTMAQIAERTQTPLGTVKRRAQLALRHLGTALSGDRS